MQKPAYKNLGLLLLRLSIGSIFLVHGYQKLADIEGTTKFMDSLGVPMANAAAWLVGLVEFVGGGLIILGLFTCLASALLAIVMLVAIFTAHADAGLTGPGGKELPVALLGGLLALMGAGSGKWSIIGKMACGSGCCKDKPVSEPIKEDTQTGCCGGCGKDDKPAEEKKTT